MRKIYSFLSLLFCLSISVPLFAQSYCEPSGVIPNFKHASSQSLYSIKVSKDATVLMDYTDANSTQSYHWIQNEQQMDVKQGDNLTVEVVSGIWSWDIVLGFDWNADGQFETEYRAFSTVGTPVTEGTSSWGVDKYNTAEKRKAIENTLGHRGVIQHIFTVSVPDDASLATTRMRVLCDGDGSGTSPALNLCQQIGYAGSMHDFGVNVKGETVENPVFSPNGGEFTGTQTVTITTATDGAMIYYTLDGTTPTTASTQYTAPINVTTTTEIKAIATKEHFLNSQVVTARFIQAGKVATPTVNIPTGTYNGEQTVEITTLTPNSEIYYTLDGTVPSKTSTKYNSPISISEKTTLKAIAYKADYVESDVLVVEYDFDWVTPGGEPHPSENRYISSATTAGAITNLTFSQNTRPTGAYIYTADSQIAAKQGTTFTLNLVSTPNMKWCRAAIYIDWNKDYTFNESDELIARIGNEKQGNDNVVNISQEITVPTTAFVGTTRIRVQYTDAWTKNDRPSFGYTANEDTYKGGVYDFDLKVVDKSTGIASITSQESLFYPTLASNVIYVANTENITIYSLSGTLMLSKIINGENSIDISDLPNGIYLVKLEKDNSTRTQKLIKN